MNSTLIFEKGGAGRRAWSLPQLPDGVRNYAAELPVKYTRKVAAGLPEVSEPELVRHYTGLSNKNYGVDTGFYPLGSCTMKYNPKINERGASLPGFLNLHPHHPDEDCQGTLALMHQLEQWLGAICGMDAFSLLPLAGAHGELTGLMLMNAYQAAKGRRRRQVIVPDSAHGTNPASAAICGNQVVEVRSNKRGCIDLAHLKELISEDTAGIMLTVPNTLGLFEEEIAEVARLIHEVDGLLYYDGANLNALMGYGRPGDFGFDIMHVNLHKTFSTPHGSGGPGAGPVGVKKHLAEFLPMPRIEKTGPGFTRSCQFPKSIGRINGFQGNVGILVRAYIYILALGGPGLQRASENAVLNANYLRARMNGLFDIPYNRLCLHEFVVSGKSLKEETEIRVMDVAKRLLDYGFHPPTTYFPLIVPECLMIEPTETETRETLDSFVNALLMVLEECRREPEVVRTAPHNLPIRRMDEVKAAKELNLCWHPGKV